MIKAKHDIDKIFGEGAAKAHPELIHAYLNASAIDFQSWAICKLNEELTETLSRGLDRIADAISEL
jgi:hypothetical protein